MRSSDWSSDVCSSELYELNGYDQRNPRTWDPRTNPYVRGHSKTTRRHPGISELTNLAYWRIKNLLTGAGTECFKALVDLQKQHKKLTKLQKKLDEGEEARSEEHTSELQSLMRISYAVFCLKKKKKTQKNTQTTKNHNT